MNREKIKKFGIWPLRLPLQRIHFIFLLTFFGDYAFKYLNIVVDFLICSPSNGNMPKINRCFVFFTPLVQEVN